MRPDVAAFRAEPVIMPAPEPKMGRLMRFLHTADWHVGKTLKGRSRLDEQEQVLREIVTIARAQEVDAVLVAGDLYETSAPHADAQQLGCRRRSSCTRPGPR